jgi:hypothetical protein
MELDLDKATVSGKLVKAYQKDGAGFGVMEVQAELPIKGLGPKSPLMVKPTSMMSLAITGDGCIDGTSAGGEMRTKMTVKIDGSTMGIDLTVVADVQQVKKGTPLK